MKYIFISIAAILLLSACTKQEFKTNFHNIKEGTKKTWHSTKEGVADATEDFKDQ